jgi:Kef-type K+ transport system membrane component KefB
MDTPFTALLVIVVVAFLAPLLLGLRPGLALPSVVLEIVAGIILGPSVLGWVEVDGTLAVLALIGLAFLLFLAGTEVDVSHLRGPRLRTAALGFAVSFAVALVVGFGLAGVGLADNALFVAIVLAATSLGIVIPLLKDAGEVGTEFGQLVIAGASIADFVTVVLLSLFFSGEEASIGSTALVLAALVVLAVIVVVSVRRSEMWRPLGAVLLRLQDTTAQIRVRGAFVLLIAWVALVGQFGLEVILGAFVAGAILTLVDDDASHTHPQLRTKIEGAGYGFFVPIFFVTSGLRFDLDALLASPSSLASAPIFLAALLIIRGLPALLYVRIVGRRRALVAALLQATSLPFIVASSMIGLELGVVDAATASALIAAGLLSVIFFPLAASSMLRRSAVHPWKPVRRASKDALADGSRASSR